VNPTAALVLQHVHRLGQHRGLRPREHERVARLWHRRRRPADGLEDRRAFADGVAACTLDDHEARDVDPRATAVVECVAHDHLAVLEPHAVSPTRVVFPAESHDITGRTAWDEHQVRAFTGRE
jgi:hypothetical protein